jgi:hypothetical protein
MKTPELKSMTRRNIALSLLLAAALSGCSTPSLPRVEVAKRAPAAADLGALDDGKLASHLAAAQAAGVSAAGESTEAFLLALQARVNLYDWKKPLRIESAGQAWLLSFDDQPLAKQGDSEWSPAMFDRLFAAGSIEAEEFTTRYAGPGAGAPVVLAYEDVARLREDRGFRPGNALFVAGTAVLDFGRACGSSTPARCAACRCAAVASSPGT